MYSEKEDLFNLIQSLDKAELIQFKTYLRGEQSKINETSSKIFNVLKKQTAYNEDYLIKKLKISKQQLGDCKFYLFHKILESLRRNDNLLNSIIDIQTLAKKGLFNKAIRKYKKLKDVLISGENYNLVAYLIHSNQGLHTINIKDDEKINKRIEAKKEHVHYLDLSKNWVLYKQLSDEVLGLHYKSGGGKLLEENPFQKYLDHPLMAGVHMAKSTLAIYVFYEIKSLIYDSLRDYENSSKYSLKCLDHLNANATPHRNDYYRLLTSYANYLGSRLRIGDVNAYKKYMPKLEKLIEKQKMNLSFQMLADSYAKKTNILLGYLSYTKNFKKFKQLVEAIKTEYDIYESMIKPNFKARILFFISKLYFVGGDLDKALNWSEKLLTIQRKNPTYYMIISGQLLTIMIHYDLGNVNLIAHLARTVEYFCKSKVEDYEAELCFVKGINKIKPFHTPVDKVALLKKLHTELQMVYKRNDGYKFAPLVGVDEWLQSKF